MPDWLIIAVAVMTPALAFGGALTGHGLNRRGAVELDVWRRREETMRTLRWGVELALDENDDRATVGFAALLALAESEMLQSDDVPFLTAVTDAALGDAVRRYPGSEAGADSEPQEVDPDA